MIPNFTSIPNMTNTTINYCPEYCIIPDYGPIIWFNVVAALVIFFISYKKEYEKVYQYATIIFIAVNLFFAIYQAFGYMDLLNLGA